MKANIASRLQTDTPLLRDLITGLKKGEIKVPKFQRRFIWREDQALNLLDSIASNYPVGSLLLWKTQGKLAAERDIGEFSLPKTDDLTPTEYVLDGQQRLTVIYSCLGAPREEKGFQVAYDLISDSFIRKPSTHQAHIFPLRLLYDTTQLLNFRVGLVSHPDGGALQNRLDQLIEVLTNYRIPVVILKDLTVEEVCPIFERINSSGTRLSTYDLMVAATWSETFDLNDETQAISTSLQVKGFGDIEGDTVLKCLSAVQYTGVKKDQVLSLRKLSREQMDGLVERVREALLKTVDLLSTEFRVYSWDFLPYEALAVVLAYIFVKRQTLSAEDTKRVRRWFWLSAFSARYRGASDTFISKDLEAIDAYVVNSTEPDGSFGSAPPVEAIEKLPFQSRNSLARAFVLLLALHNPKNLTNGVRIDTEEALSIFNKKEFHHIFPQAYLKSQAVHGEHNSVANICMLSASENKAVSDSDPHDYLPRLTASHGDEARAIFESNLLPDPTTFPYDVIPYEQFVKKRSEMLHAKILTLCEGGAI